MLGMLQGPAATAVTSLLNGTIRLEIDSEGGMKATTKKFDRFPPFSKLPTEVRLQI